MVEVAETCEIALERLRWLENKDLDKDENPYASVDPTPAAGTKDIVELKRILLDDNESLFSRYRAMFSLRNLRCDEATVALSAGLKGSSALFRHEVAFVLGQLQHEVSVPFLAESLRDEAENEMVRHECAEALGAIATDECTKILKEYLTDSKRVVKESCEVALDMCEYENSPEFQYANGLNDNVWLQNKNGFLNLILRHWKIRVLIRTGGAFEVQTTLITFNWLGDKQLLRFAQMIFLMNFGFFRVSLFQAPPQDPKFNWFGISLLSL